MIWRPRFTGAAVPFPNTLCLRGVAVEDDGSIRCDGRPAVTAASSARLARVAARVAPLSCPAARALGSSLAATAALGVPMLLLTPGSRLRWRPWRQWRRWLPPSDRWPLSMWRFHPLRWRRAAASAATAATAAAAAPGAVATAVIAGLSFNSVRSDFLLLLVAVIAVRRGFVCFSRTRFSRNCSSRHRLRFGARFLLAR